MGHIERRLDKLGLTLPTPLVPPGNFGLVKVHNGLAYISGHGPFNGSTLLVQGLVGRDLTMDEAYEAARMTALSMLASRISRPRRCSRENGLLGALGCSNRVGCAG